jgi:hypothetical protein
MENQQLFETLLSDYQIRKSKKQKLGFISFVKERCLALGWSCRVEEKKSFVYNRNIVVGDINPTCYSCRRIYHIYRQLHFAGFIYGGLRFFFSFSDWFV